MIEIFEGAPDQVPLPSFWECGVDRSGCIMFSHGTTQFEGTMIQTVEAVIEPDGTVRLLQPLQVNEPRRALLTVLPSHLTTDEITLLSEPALADWNRPEEDEAWSYLNPGK